MGQRKEEVALYRKSTASRLSTEISTPSFLDWALCHLPCSPKISLVLLFLIINIFEYKYSSNYSIPIHNYSRLNFINLIFFLVGEEGSMLLPSLSVIIGVFETLYLYFVVHH